MTTGDRALNLWDVIAARHSCRAYRQEAVPEEALRRIVDAARAAPSACNQQPWRIAVVRDNARRRKLIERGLLPGIRMTWAREAPVVVALGMTRNVTTHRLGAFLSGVDYPWLDVGIAGEHLVLAATALGLGTCWIGWIRPRRVRAIIGWSRDVRAVGLVTVGYPDEGVEPRETTRLDASETVMWM